MRRFWQTFRLWITFNPYAGLDVLVARHEKCCAKVVESLRKKDITEAQFNRTLADTYEECGKLKCEASGFHRRFMIYLFVIKQRGWRL